MRNISRQFQFEVDNNKYIFDGDEVVLFPVVNSISKYKILRNEKSNSDTFRKNFLYTVALNLINKCNLTCEYCFANQGNYDNPNQRMSFEVAKKSIDLTLESVIKNKHDEIRIAFFGGEPMLEFELIKQIVHYVNTKVPITVTPTYLITTNGTIMDEEISNFFQKNNFIVTISIDGDQETHDFYRKFNSGKGSYQSVRNCINILIDKVPIIGRITVNHNNFDIHNHVEHLVSLGFKEITFAYDYNIYHNTFNKFTSSIDTLMKNYISDIKNRKYYNLTNITSVLLAIALNLKTKSHCSAGKSYLSVSSEGNIYKCPRFTGVEKHSFGKIDTNQLTQIESEIRMFDDSLQTSVADRDGNCNYCTFIYLCGGMCYHHSFTKSSGSQFTRIESECNYRKQLYKRTLELIVKLTPLERRDFIRFLMTNRDIVTN
ncbi:radical SAM/SPASM domain-containing protein [Senegalia massiliensis]|uniref:radical SAM/SPASM domain-containing protein n=1 Tax=Senegalia massiliensis TaxID=1720316 RepID=UPI001031CC47|nr:radical SAM protein [Senegalia massiliensis]